METLDQNRSVVHGPIQRVSVLDVINYAPNEVKCVQPLVEEQKRDVR